MSPPLPARQRPGPLRIGAKLIVDPPLLQAPMSSITTLPMRTLAEEQGCALTITEWLPASSLAANNREALNKLLPSRAGRPFGVQVFGRDSVAMRKAAALAASRGADLVDINMGCPGKKVRSGSCGAALMLDPQLATTLVRAVCEGVDGAAAVSVKMRSGWDDADKNAPELAPRLVDAGAQMITVHGRTRQQRYSGVVDLTVIRRVKDALGSIPVVANGDIVDLASMAHAFEQTGADGVMVGRAATGNPWLFGELRCFWSGAPSPRRPSPRQRVAMYQRHLTLYLEVAPPRQAVIEMRKFAGWYLVGVPNGERLRRAINQLEDATAIGRLLEDYLSASSPPQRA